MQRQGNVNFQMNRSTEILLPRARTDKKCRNYTLALVMVILLLGAIVGGKLTYDYWLENRWIDIEECRIDDCGKVGPDFISSRIIGGSDARVDEFPFQVAITLMDDSKVYCGGNMINDRWILTAAHCLRLSGDMQVKKSAIRVSVAILKTSEVRSNSIGIDDYFVHPNYDPEKGKKYDIALIKTSQPIPSNSKRYTNPICLPFDNNDSEDAQIAQVVGFGLRQQDAQESSDTLRKTKVSLLSSTECYRTYYLNYDASSMICAGDLRGGQDTCQGDSGGPLAIKNTNGSYVLKGITSYGAGCGRPNTPGVYTKVSHYMMWMCRKMLNNGLYYKVKD